MAKVAVVLTHGFADWEYALIAGTGRAFYGLDVRFFAPEAGEVSSQGGLVATVQYGVDSMLEWKPEAVVIVGGNIWTSEESPDLSELLLKHYEKGGVVAGICGGTIALADAGLLDGVHHTSNDAEFLVQNVLNYSGAGLFRQSVGAVSDNRIITAPGTAPVSFTAEIFKSLGLDSAVVNQFREMLAAEHL